MKFRPVGKPYLPRNLNGISELKLAGILIIPLERTTRLTGKLFLTLNLTVIFLRFPIVKWPQPIFGNIIPEFKMSFFMNIWVLSFSII